MLVATADQRILQPPEFNAFSCFRSGYILRSPENFEGDHERILRKCVIRNAAMQPSGSTLRNNFAAVQGQ